MPRIGKPRMDFKPFSAEVLFLLLPSTDTVRTVISWLPYNCEQHKLCILMKLFDTTDNQTDVIFVSKTMTGSPFAYFPDSVTIDSNFPSFVFLLTASSSVFSETCTRITPG